MAHGPSESAWEVIARVGTVIGLLLPVTGAIQRYAMFYPSSLQDRYAVIAPLPELALTGAESTFWGLLIFVSQLPLAILLTSGEISFGSLRRTVRLELLGVVLAYVLFLVYLPFPGALIELVGIQAAVLISAWIVRASHDLTLAGMLPGIAIAVMAIAVGDGLNPGAAERASFLQSNSRPTVAGWYSVVARSPEFLYAYSCTNHTVVALAPGDVTITYPEQALERPVDQSLWTIIRGEVSMKLGFDPICPERPDPPPGVMP